MNEVRQVFDKFDGVENEGFPFIDSQVYFTRRGTPYLKAPGVVMVAKPDVNLNGTGRFLEGFGRELNFSQYLDDPGKLLPAEALVKFAGQLCYASFGEGRTLNANAQQYFDNIIASGHGSVLEHPNFTFLWYGVSRTLTHELVRHRAGMGYSQLSQRYVSGKVLRFVERPEYQNVPELHKEFERRIDLATVWYKKVAQALLVLQGTGEKLLGADAKTDLRKKVQQAARSVLPGETETHVVLTGNVRALRHISSMRASKHAEVEIREAAFRTWLCLAIAAPMLVKDYKMEQLSDGTWGVQTEHPKV
ncbi:MAG: FAD-dependent thymidylate synthase [Patescibacteria group bacterium]